MSERPRGGGKPAPPSRRGRWTVILFIALALLLAAGLGSWLWIGPRPPPPPAVDLAGADPAVVTAIEAARARAAAEPRSADAWGRLAMLFLAHEFPEPAVRAFAQAEALRPSEPRWPYLRGLAFLAGEPRPEEAIASLRRAAGLAGGEGTPRLKLAEALLEQGRAAEAEALCREAMKADPGNARALLGAGRAAYARGDLEAAARDLQAAAAGAPRVRAAHLLLAEIHHRRGDLERAEAERRLAAGLPDGPAWPDKYAAEVEALRVGALARIDRAGALFAAGRGREAIDLLRETARQYPNALLVRLALGRFLLDLKSPAEAEEALRGAVGLAPDAFEAHHELGLALERQGKTAAAAASFRAALAIKPGYAPSHYRLGLALYREGDRAGALQALREAARFRPDFGEGHRALAQLLALEGQNAEAMVHLEQALRLDPGDAEARRMLDSLRERGALPGR